MVGNVTCIAIGDRAVAVGVEFRQLSSLERVVARQIVIDLGGIRIRETGGGNTGGCGAGGLVDLAAARTRGASESSGRTLTHFGDTGFSSQISPIALLLSPIFHIVATHGSWVAIGTAKARFACGAGRARPIAGARADGSAIIVSASAVIVACVRIARIHMACARIKCARAALSAVVARQGAN